MQTKECSSFWVHKVNLPMCIFMAQKKNSNTSNSDKSTFEFTHTAVTPVITVTDTWSGQF